VAETKRLPVDDRTRPIGTGQSYLQIPRDAGPFIHGSSAPTHTV
jgi:hypothetical protein